MIQTLGFRVRGSKNTTYMLWTAVLFALGGAIIGACTRDLGNILFGAFGGLFVGMVLFVKSQENTPQHKLDTPHVKKSNGYARVRRGIDGDLVFECMRQDRVNNVLLREIAAFEFGDWEHWFADAHETGRYHKYFVIIANTHSGILLVACHSGSKADIANLHTVLTTELVVNRKKFAPNKPAPRTVKSPASPRPEKPATL